MGLLTTGASNRATDDVPPPRAAACAASAAPPPQGGDKRPRHRRVFKLACVRPDTPLTVALGLLLEAGVSCLPVVDPSGVLLDLYARADICMLAKVGRWGALVHAWLWGEALNICMHAGKGDAMACLPLESPNFWNGYGCFSKKCAAGHMEWSSCTWRPSTP